MQALFTKNMTCVSGLEGTMINLSFDLGVSFHYVSVISASNALTEGCK